MSAVKRDWESFAKLKTDSAVVRARRQSEQQKFEMYANFYELVMRVKSDRQQFLESRKRAVELKAAARRRIVQRLQRDG